MWSCFSLKRVEEGEVMRLLGALDVNKAVGVDAISAKLLQMAALGISASLASLFNHSPLSIWTNSSRVEVSECNSTAKE